MQFKFQWSAGLALNGLPGFFFIIGIHRHAMAGAFGVFAGEYLQNWRCRVAAERDLQYYHYMTLHPEDFPPPSKSLYLSPPVSSSK